MIRSSANGVELREVLPHPRALRRAGREHRGRRPGDRSRARRPNPPVARPATPWTSRHGWRPSGQATRFGEARPRRQPSCGRRSSPRDEPAPPRRACRSPCRGAPSGSGRRPPDRGRPRPLGAGGGGSRRAAAGVSGVGAGAAPAGAASPAGGCGASVDGARRRARRAGAGRGAAAGAAAAAAAGAAAATPAGCGNGGGATTTGAAALMSTVRRGSSWPGRTRSARTTFRVDSSVEKRGAKRT